MKNMSPSSRDIYVLGFIYILLVMLQDVTSSDVWRELLGKRAIAIISTIITGLIAWRAYVDKSVARGKIADEFESEPTPVTVANTEENPVPTTMDPSPEVMPVAERNPHE